MYPDQVCVDRHRNDSRAGSKHRGEIAEFFTMYSDDSFPGDSGHRTRNHVDCVIGRNRKVRRHQVGKR